MFKTLTGNILFCWITYQTTQQWNFQGLRNCAWRYLRALVDSFSSTLLECCSTQPKKAQDVFFPPMSLKQLNTSDSCSTEAECLDFSFYTLSNGAEGRRQKESPQLADNLILFSASQMWKATGMMYVVPWEGWSPYGRVLIASASRKVCPQLIWGEESVPAPVLPPASIAQSTHLFYTIWGVPIALSPYLALWVVALLNEGAPALMTVSSDRLFALPNLSWELLLRSCCYTISQGTTLELQTLSQRQSQHHRNNSSPKKPNRPLISL